jgi:hypothetical protein
VLSDTETEVAGVGEVPSAELVLLDLERTLNDLLGLGAADRDVAGDLLVTADAEAAERVAGLRRHGRLARELLEHLGGTRESVTRLADGDVDDELVNAQLLQVEVSAIARALLLGHICGCLDDRTPPSTPSLPPEPASL